VAKKAASLLGFLIGVVFAGAQMEIFNGGIEPL
jgi:hypothetical protein